MGRIGILVACCLLITAGVWLALSGPDGTRTETSSTAASGSHEDGSGASASRAASPGSSAADVHPSASDTPAAASGPGRVPPCDPAAHPQARAVAEALHDGGHPERLSVLQPPAPFDEAAWRADSEAYLAISEPGRVLQSHPAGAGVAPLRAAGPTRFRMRQGQTRRLRVQAVPDAPVSFLAVDNGRFIDNTLPAITVRTDAQGIAEVTYEATPGVINEATIMCSCPLTSGRVRFAVFVVHERQRTAARRPHEPASAAVSAD